MQLATFLKLVFTADKEGYVCIASRPAREKKGFKEAYFYWPRETDKILSYVEERTFTHDLWFCPQLLNTKKRDRSSVGCTPNVWADLDTCEPGNLLIKPTVVIQSSPDRYQAFWTLEDDDVLPADAEAAARRLAYYHKDDGADISGWDLTQLLRLLHTKNFKYSDSPVVTLQTFRNETVPLQDFFDAYPEVEGIADVMEEPMPRIIEPATDVLTRHRGTLNPLASILFAEESQKGERSSDLWKLECVLFESGLSAADVFQVVREAHCNKYEEDKRDIQLLWRDVLRAKQYLQLQIKSQVSTLNNISAPPLLNDDERYQAEHDITIIEEYTKWATLVTDAAEQYHPVCALMMLSSLFSGRLHLATQFGKMTTNLWFMLLADTTRTRKSTAMELALDMLYEIDDNALLANDGSVEGLLDAVAARPGKASLFHRDEFAGLLKGMMTKEYMAGLPETFTKMYDGKQMKRILRKQTIDLRKPVFILFTGGTKSTILQLLNGEQVESGFLPRFIFVTADSTTMPPERPLGPPTMISRGGRDEIKQKLAARYEYYTTAVQTISMNGQAPRNIPKEWEAELSEEAWQKYNDFAGMMQQFATSHPQAVAMMPCMNRLAMSGLKTAVLIAASRENHEDKVQVSELDVIHAFYYVEQWRGYLFEVLDNLGKSPFERLISEITTLVTQEPGIKRGEVMRRKRLSARQADEAIATAEQRMLLTTRKGKVVTLWPYDTIGE